MSEWEGSPEDDELDELDNENSCDYGCCEICEEPQTKENGLCTTECAAYMKSVREEQEAPE